MAIISIFSGPFCHGERVASAISEQMGYARIDQEILSEASQRFNVAEEKLRASFTGGSPSLFGKNGHDREKHVACIRLVLAERIQDDHLIIFGHSGLLLPRSLSHVLRVCLIANLDFRVRLAMEEHGVNEKQAVDLVHRGDKNRSLWTQYLFGRAPYEPGNYDLLLPMHELSPGDAAGQIFINAAKDAIRTTDASRQAAGNFLLAANVHLALAEKGHEVEVSADNGLVTIAVNRYTNRLEALQRQLEKIAAAVENVRTVKCIPGTGFVPPGLVPIPDLPRKVLLVDDEKEFVHSLSERLQTRRMESSVVYDGEQALEFIRTNEPEVMVLDLKMPGIDGIEVLRRVKLDHPAVEVIILTGHGSEREEKLALELGAFAYLTKPVNIDLLASTMKAAYQKLGHSSENRDE